MTRAIASGWWNGPASSIRRPPQSGLPARSNRSVSPLDPLLIECRVLHALSAFDEVAVHAVDQTVPRLDDRRIVVRTRRLLLQMPRLRPRPPFIAGERHGQAVPTASRIV